VDGADWADDEPFEARPPLPPEDRVWRHPSELAASPLPLAPAAFVGDQPVQWGRMTGLFVVATAGAVLVAFAFHLAFRPGPSVLRTEGVTGTPVAVTAVASTVLSAPGGKAWLGIAGTDVDGVATVGEVRPGSPAAVGGLEADDQVVAVDGSPVAGMAQLVAAIGRRAPGDTCRLTVLREGSPLDLTVVLGGNT
jgi:membrane-associated protease RseP (regulator of RpoE activity)